MGRETEHVVIKDGTAGFILRCEIMAGEDIYISTDECVGDNSLMECHCNKLLYAPEANTLTANVDTSLNLSSIDECVWFALLEL